MQIYEKDLIAAKIFVKKVRAGLVGAKKFSNFAGKRQNLYFVAKNSPNIHNRAHGKHLHHDTDVFNRGSIPLGIRLHSIRERSTHQQSADRADYVRIMLDIIYVWLPGICGGVPQR